MDAARRAGVALPAWPPAVAPQANGGVARLCHRCAHAGPTGLGSLTFGGDVERRDPVLQRGGPPARDRGRNQEVPRRARRPLRADPRGRRQRGRHAEGHRRGHGRRVQRAQRPPRSESRQGTRACRRRRHQQGRPGPAHRRRPLDTHRGAAQARSEARR